MKEQDNIEKLFKNLEGSLNIEETPANHQQRFLERLEVYNSQQKKTSSWWKPLSIAAAIVLLIASGFFFQNNDTTVDGLASVSTEMMETQAFFTTAIEQELETLKNFKDEETQILVEDAMQQLTILEQEYDKLKIDLVESGNDKRVVAAMISNFQKRIEILQQVIKTIEEIKTLKANRNETTI